MRFFIRVTNKGEFLFLSNNTSSGNSKRWKGSRWPVLREGHSWKGASLLRLKGGGWIKYLMRLLYLPVSLHRSWALPCMRNWDVPISHYWRKPPHAACKSHTQTPLSPERTGWRAEQGCWRAAGTWGTCTSNNPLQLLLCLPWLPWEIVLWGDGSSPPSTKVHAVFLHRLPNITKHLIVRKGPCFTPKACIEILLMLTRVLFWPVTHWWLGQQQQQISPASSSLRILSSGTLYLEDASKEGDCLNCRPGMPKQHVLKILLSNHMKLHVVPYHGITCGPSLLVG